MNYRKAEDENSQTSCLQDSEHGQGRFNQQKISSEWIGPKDL